MQDLREQSNLLRTIVEGTAAETGDDFFASLVTHLTSTLQVSETTVALRREFPDVKVIVITGGSDMIGILNFLDVAKMLGAHGTLQNPFEMKTLLDAVTAQL